jgi:hypothetical protein
MRQADPLRFAIVEANALKKGPNGAPINKNAANNAPSRTTPGHVALHCSIPKLDMSKNICNFNFGGTDFSRKNDHNLLTQEYK